MTDDYAADEYRKCANGELLGCAALWIAFLAGFVVGWIVRFP